MIIYMPLLVFSQQMFESVHEHLFHAKTQKFSLRLISSIFGLCVNSFEHLLYFHQQPMVPKVK